MNSRNIFLLSMSVKIFLASLCLFFIGSRYFELNVSAPVEQIMSINQAIDTSSLLLDSNNCATPLSDCTSYDRNGFTQLMSAAVLCDINAACYCIGKALGLEQPGSILNAKSRNIDQQTYRQDPTVSQPSPIEYTALHFAVFNSKNPNCVEIAKKLIAAGASTRELDSQGNTALHILAAQTQNNYLYDQEYNYKKDLASLLIKGGTDINAQNSDGDTAAHRSAYLRDRTWIELQLKEFGTISRFDITNSRGYKPNTLASDLLGFTDVSDIIDGKLNPGVKVNPVIVGATINRRNKYIINNANARDTVGLTALMLAVIAGNGDFAQKLIAKGADVNAKDQGRGDLANSALHFALLHQKPDMVKLLLDKRANPNIENAFGDRPLHYVLKIDQIYKTIDQMNDMRNTTAQYLVDGGADINARNNDGNTIFHMAVKENAASLVKFLIQKYSNRIDLSVKNGKHQTAYDLAQAMGRKAIVGYFDSLIKAQEFARLYRDNCV